MLVLDELQRTSNHNRRTTCHSSGDLRVCPRHGLTELQNQQDVFSRREPRLAGEARPQTPHPERVPEAPPGDGGHEAGQGPAAPVRHAVFAEHAAQVASLAGREEVRQLRSSSRRRRCRPKAKCSAASAWAGCSRRTTARPRDPTTHRLLASPRCDRHGDPARCKPGRGASHVSDAPPVVFTMPTDLTWLLGQPSLERVSVLGRTM